MSVADSYQLRFPESRSVISDLASEECVRSYLDLLRGYNNSTFEHSLRTGLLCVDLGFENGVVRASGLHLLGRAGLFHDIGKLGIPLYILDKEGPLTDFERLTINEHSRMGFELLHGLGDELRQTVVGHHEYQENAYPRFTRRRRAVRPGRERRANNPRMEWFSQIVAACDLYESLRSERSYKAGMDVAETGAIMKGSFTGDTKYVDQLLTR